MSLRTTYLLLSVLGFVLPYAQFVPWIAMHGVDAPLFFRELFANRISGFFGLDVMVSAVVLLVFARAETRRLRRTVWWATLAATLLVGVSFGLPLFLYLREGREPVV